MVRSTIQPLTPADIPAVVTLQSACAFDGWAEDWYEVNCHNADVILLTSKLHSHLIGFASAQKLADELEIYLVAVSPAFRRQQIASGLLQELINVAQAKKLTAVFLEVRAGNVAAQNLYHSFGFSQAGSRRNYYQNPVEDAHLLRLAI